MVESLVLAFALSVIRLSAAVLGSYLTGNPWIGVLMGMLAGLVASGIHALVCVEFGGMHAISGLGLTMLCNGIARFLCISIFGSTYSPNVTALQTTDILAGIPVVGGFLSQLSPLIYIGILLGVEALGGMLAGALSSGVLLAIMMANAGGAWDNAKKYIEEGHFGGKGSDSHKAAVVGATVGDPFKDTSGPSINILIKLMTIVSLVFAPLFLSIGTIF